MQLFYREYENVECFALLIMVLLANERETIFNFINKFRLNHGGTASIKDSEH